MQRSPNSSRFRSALTSGSAAVLVLLAISVNISGLDGVSWILKDFWPLFAVSAVLAFVVGLFLKKRRLRWSALAGAATGLVCALLILMFTVSGI